MRETPLISEKKERNRIRLSDRYYGKKDILTSWEERGLMSTPKFTAPERVENDYIYHLRRRIRCYQNDLAYRGVDGFTDLVGGTHASDL